jgi:hypothetical protein
MLLLFPCFPGSCISTTHPFLLCFVSPSVNYAFHFRDRRVFYALSGIFCFPSATCHTRANSTNPSGIECAPGNSISRPSSKLKVRSRHVTVSVVQSSDSALQATISPQLALERSLSDLLRPWTVRFCLTLALPMTLYGYARMKNAKR